MRAGQTEAERTKQQIGEALSWPMSSKFGGLRFTSFRRELPTTEPEERNGIVHALKGGLSALKEGAPSMNFLVAALVRPLQFITEKFAGAAMGELAKHAVKKLVEFLFS